MATINPHTTRATGTILTAAIYNGDHVNHVNNANNLNSAKLEAPVVTANIGDDQVTNGKLANMTGQSIKMRNNASAGDPQDQIHTDITTATPTSGDFALGWTAAGLIRKYDVLNLGGGAPSMPRRAITGADTVGTSDKAGIIEITANSFTLAFTAAATLGANFWCIIYNNGTGDVTLDPNSTEQIDGLTSWILYPGGGILVHCNGTLFESILLSPMVKTFDSSGTFTKPGVGSRVRVRCVGGGGGGGRAAAGGNAGGGGGGSSFDIIIPFASIGATETVTIGAAGTAAGSNSTNGGAGGNTTFGSHLTGFGGGGGGFAVAGSAALPGGGGIIGAAGTTPHNNPPSSENAVRNWFLTGSNLFNTIAPNIGGLGAKAADGCAGTSAAGASAVLAGAGGGGKQNATLVAAGTSTGGGNGGASGSNGSQPGGGGGGNVNATAGAGGAGRCVVEVF